MARWAGITEDRRIATRDIVVIGTSAGGVEALTDLISGLPHDLKAALFAVMHVSPSRRSALPEILARNGGLAVSHPQDHDVIKPKNVYVAPPDFHLLIEPDRRMRLWHGPKENNFRPGINPLFRSAADVYKERVIGILLSGGLDEGVAGLAWIKRHGGIVVVQDPSEAKFPDLPQSALRHVSVDYILGTSEIAKLVAEMAGNEMRKERKSRE